MSDTPIRAVTFDVGGTLIEPWPSVGDVYAEVAARHGAPMVSPSVLNKQFEEAWNGCTEFGYTRADWETIVARTFRGLIPSVSHFFPHLYERFAEPEVWRVFEDVRPTLALLREKEVRCGVISNWDERLRLLLRRLNLDAYFDAFAISCEVGATKPHARIFGAAADRLDVEPESILHVGDSASRDVEGARRAGFQAVRICRNGAADANSIPSLRLIADLVSRELGPMNFS